VQSSGCSGCSQLGLQEEYLSSLTARLHGGAPFKVYLVVDPEKEARLPWGKPWVFRDVVGWVGGASRAYAFAAALLCARMLTRPNRAVDYSFV
jgi:hypothetical protein